MNDDYITHVLHLIQVHLEAGVPEEIRRIEQRGGITPDDFERVRSHALHLATHGDALLFYTKGQSAPAMTELIESVAVLSYCPGGISTFGLHFGGQEIGRRYREMAQAACPLTEAEE